MEVLYSFWFRSLYYKNHHYKWQHWEKMELELSNIQTNVLSFGRIHSCNKSFLVQSIPRIVYPNRTNMSYFHPYRNQHSAVCFRGSRRWCNYEKENNNHQEFHECKLIDTVTKYAWWKEYTIIVNNVDQIETGLRIKLRRQINFSLFKHLLFFVQICDYILIYYWFGCLSNLIAELCLLISLGFSFSSCGPAGFPSTFLCPPCPTKIKLPTNVSIILGFTSTISSHKRKMQQPMRRATPIASLAFNINSSPKE